MCQHFKCPSTNVENLRRLLPTDWSIEKHYGKVMMRIGNQWDYVFSLFFFFLGGKKFLPTRHLLLISPHPKPNKIWSQDGKPPAGPKREMTRCKWLSLFHDMLNSSTSGVASSSPMMQRRKQSLFSFLEVESRREKEDGDGFFFFLEGAEGGARTGRGMRKVDLNKLVKAGHLTFAIGAFTTLVRLSFFDWWRLRRQD